MDATEKIICSNCQAEVPSAAKFCSVCGHELLEKGHPHWIFVDTFMKTGEIAKYVKDYAKIFLSPYRTTIRNFEERTFRDSLKFLEFSVGIAALFIIFSSIVIEGWGFISGILNILVLLATWSGFFGVFYFMTYRSAKATKRSYHEFLEMSAWMLGYTFPLGHILLWLQISIAFMYIAAVYKLLILAILLIYSIFLMLYIARIWKYFWGLSHMGVFWRYLFSILIAGALNYVIVAGINTVSNAKPGHSHFLAEKARRYQDIVNKERSGVAVMTEKVAFRTITERISANGNIFPRNEIIITADVSGEIVELYVKEGDPVTAGQVLAKINPRDYQREVERGQAALNAAQAQLKISASDLKKANPSQLTTARQLVQAAELNVANAQAALKELRSSLQRTVITAPVSGTISKLNVKKGERVVGTLQMAGTEMMRIADENNIVVRAEISEPDILKISKGQEAEIITDAYPDIKLKGLVTQILPLQPKKEISLGDQIANYVVEISIAPASYSNLIKDGEKNPFIPGMPASVDIVTQVIQNTLGISIVAVTSREIHTSEDTTFVGSSKELLQNENNAHPVNDGNLGEVVFAVSGDSVLMVDVKTGIQDSEYIQIVSGLKEGQEVVIGPYSTISKKLANGTKIKRIRQ